MDNNFILLCSLIMIPMIFFVPVMYINAYANSESSTHLTTMTAAILCGITCWLFFGNIESFQFSFLNLNLTTLKPTITVLSQLCFYLYALIMFVGTSVQKIKWQFLIIFIPLWTFFVYAPLANLIWSSNGFLYRLGALDFSGGLVVHLTAGLTSLILSFFMRNTKPPLPRDSPLLNYVATLFILTSWLGFNLAPAGVFQNHGPLIVINTLTAVIGAVVGWTSGSRLGLSLDSSTLYNGIICGLVTSTALVAYVSTPSMLIVTLISGLICHYVTDLLADSTYFYDPVDSFGINGIGGLVGTLGLILFATPTVNKAGATGLLSGGLKFAEVEGLTLIVTILITLLGTLVCLGLIKIIKILILSRRKEAAF